MKDDIKDSEVNEVKRACQNEGSELRAEISQIRTDKWHRIERF